MDKDTVVAAINCLKDRLHEDGIRVTKIVLYGSRTRGDVQEDSDIDLLVVSDDFREKNIFERAAITKNAEVFAMKKFQVPFDIITLTTEEFQHGGSLFTQFAEDGETVYDAGG
jgi:predicted nucleotidyltransferase